MLHGEEIFADNARNALMRRGFCLWSLLRSDPRFSFYGRTVALNDPEYDPAGNVADMLEWLARLQGVTVCYEVLPGNWTVE